MPGDMLNDPIERMLDQEQSEEEAQINADKAALARDSERKLIHRVFRQTPSGVELLELWIDKHLLHTDPIRKGEQHDTNDIALEVGLQNFIRAINRACEGIDNQKPE